MKFSSTIPLALTLAAGVAAAAAAQTPATSSAGTPATPQATAPTTPTGSNLGQQGYSENQAGPTEQMKAKQPRNRPVAQMPRASTEAQNFTPDQVRMAQGQLHAAGLYNGPTDGLMDPDTRAALARFQDQNGLRRTETLDGETLARLNSSETTGSGSSMPPASPATSTATSTATSPATSPAAPNSNTGATAAPLGAGGNTAGQPQPAARY